MYLNRKLQKAILTELRDHYPNHCTVERLVCYEAHQEFNGNLFYLEEHGLLTGQSHMNKSRDNAGLQMSRATITSKGLDFLEDDGGLGAILSTIRVRIDSEEVNALISAHFDKANITKEKQNEILSVIRSLPSEGIKLVYKRLIEYGLDMTPNVFELIQKLLGQP